MGGGHDLASHHVTAKRTKTGLTWFYDDAKKDRQDMKLTFADGQSSEFYHLQYHFHAPSEHTIQGHNMDLELHIVHKYLDDSLGGVIGIMFDRQFGGDRDNEFIEQLTGFMGTKVGEESHGHISMKKFVDELDLGNYWSYDGSLTTPPCTEGIKWSMLKTVMPISARQLKMFTKLWADDPSFANGKGNNRVVQPLNQRTVYLSKEQVYWGGNPLYYYMVPITLASGGVLLVAIPIVYAYGHV